MNKKLIFTALISLSISISGCGSKQAVQPTSNTIGAQTNTKPQAKPQALKPITNNTVTTPNSTNTTKPSVAKSTTTTTTSTIVKPSQAPTINYADISTKTKAYIMSNQGSKTEAEKIIWDITLLNRVNMESLYNQYLSTGGIKDNIRDFAIYITKNAPIQGDWKEVFEKAVYKMYGQKIVSYKYIGNDVYQAYIMSNGKEFAYVGVNARTGRYHG